MNYKIIKKEYIGPDGDIGGEIIKHTTLKLGASKASCPELAG